METIKKDHLLLSFGKKLNRVTLKKINGGSEFDHWVCTQQPYIGSDDYYKTYDDKGNCSSGCTPPPGAHHSHSN